MSDTVSIKTDDKKILLVLDLDETMIHATKDKLSFPEDLRYGSYYVYKRPYLDHFLFECYKHFDLAVWSSASDDYVNEIVKHLTPPKIAFEFVWGESKCTIRKDFDLDTYVFEKQLKKVKKKGYPMEKILIVDDSPEKTKSNYGNAIYIKPFEGDLVDNELENLTNYLASIKQVNNVRAIEKRGWRQKIK